VYLSPLGYAKYLEDSGHKQHPLLLLQSNSQSILPSWGDHSLLDLIKIQLLPRTQIKPVTKINNYLKGQEFFWGRERTNSRTYFNHQILIICEGHVFGFLIPYLYHHILTFCPSHASFNLSSIQFAKLNKSNEVLLVEIVGARF
jgi:hypothetical protein